jgi:predicted secreted protein
MSASKNKFSFKAIAVANAIFAFSSTSTHAADAAQLRAIGYSDDGRYFAFEQYGVQDGSGFPYSDVFVIDLPADQWVKGTPARALIESEESDIAAARAQAMAQAAPVMDGLKLTGAFDTLAYLPFTQVVSDRSRVRFGRYYDSAGNPANYQHVDSWELAVKGFPLAAATECQDTDFAPTMGMELTLKNAKSGATKTLAKDTAIPASRYCPIGYDLEAVFAPAAYGLKAEYLVAVIGVYSRGFEGSNRRFVAVPFELIE